MTPCTGQSAEDGEPCPSFPGTAEEKRQHTSAISNKSLVVASIGAYSMLETGGQAWPKGRHVIDFSAQGAP